MTTSTFSRRRALFIAAAAVAALILAGGVVAYYVYLPAAPPAAAGHDEDLEEHDFEATVRVTGAGFEPATVNVKPKTRVYFENGDGVEHNLVADARPPDPNFGSTANIPVGGGYGFTFIEGGVYRFHDANNPTIVGEVVVTGT